MDTFSLFTWALTATTIFLVWGLCNMLWLSVDFNRGIYAQAALYVVFIGFNIYGWRQWGKKDNIHELKLQNERIRELSEHLMTTYHTQDGKIFIDNAPAHLITDAYLYKDK